MDTEEFMGDFLAGGVSTSLNRMGMLPYERNAQANMPVYESGFIDYLERYASQNGIFSFWRGNIQVMLRIFPQRGLQFAINDLTKILITSHIEPKQQTLNYLLSCLLCGATTALFNFRLLFPVQYDISMLQKVARLQKIAIILNGTLYFGLYDFGRGRYQDENNYSLPKSFLISYMASKTAARVVYPIDLTSQRLRIMFRNDEQCNKSIREYIRIIVRNEGLKSMMVLRPIAKLRSTGGAIVLTLYDYFKQNNYLSRNKSSL